MTTRPMKAISAPFCNKDATGYYYGWNEGDERFVAIGITNIQDNFQQHAITAEVEIGLDGALYDSIDAVKSVLTHARINLNSLSSRQTLVRTIKESAINEIAMYIPWEQMLHQVISLTIADIRKSDKAVELDFSGENNIEPPEYALFPFVIKGMPNIIFAERGGAKTLLSTLFSIAMSMHIYDEALNLKPGTKEACKVLYLDWEQNERLVTYTFKTLLDGMGVGYCPIVYKRCKRPLIEEIGEVLQVITQKGIDTILIDSLGLAAGGDLNATAPALQFFSALRQLDNMTFLILAHTAKNGDFKNRTVYGNVYYENEARNIWETRKVQVEGSSECDLTLFHKKPPPFAGIQAPIAFHSSFNGNKTYVSAADPATEGNSNDEPGKLEILAAAIEELNGESATYKQLFDMCQGTIPMEQIRVYAGRLIKLGRAKRISNGVVTNA